VRILVVDDDPVSRSAIVRYLADGGWQDIVQAGSALEAFSALGIGARAVRTIDLVLLDVELPAMNGLVALQRIKNVQRLRGLPVIIVTGHTEEEFIESAFATGAIDYVSKPIRPRELVARVRNALRLKRERDRRTTREHVLQSAAKELEQTNRTLEFLTGQDTLTGIANRRHFQQAFRSEWRRAARVRDALSLVLLDVDFFHAFNERYGHLAGDECLRAIAQALAHELRRAGDLVARWGGEEFVVVLPSTEEDGARQVAEQMRARVAALGLPHERSVCAGHVTISAGVATERPSVDKAPETLLAAADDALFQAKHAGRDRIHVAGTGSTPAGLVVQVESWAASRVPPFLESRKRDVRVLVDALERHAFDVVLSIGQSLRAESAGLGLGGIGEIGGRLEEGARAQAGDAVGRAIEELARYLEEIQIVPR
jgi:diguanylate cyclase (GGDEF)-like protein